MKKIYLLFFITIILFSCAILPGPTEGKDSLVIGKFIFNFPDGFFDEKPKKIVNNIKVNFINLNTNANFSRKTKSGYFYFLLNSDHDFLLESIEYSEGRYSIGPLPIEIKIKSAKNTIMYLGDIVFKFAMPEKTGSKTFRSEGEDFTFVQRTVSYNYRISLSIENKKSDVKNFIRKNNPESIWLKYDIDDRYVK